MIISSRKDINSHQNSHLKNNMLAKTAFTGSNKINQKDYFEYPKKNMSNSPLRKRIIKPHNLETYVLRALNRFQSGNYQGALEDYTQVINQKPYNVKAYFDRGSVISLLKDYEKAISDYTKAIKLNPSSSDTYYNRGFAHYELALLLAKQDNNTGAIIHFKKSIEDYSQVLIINPHDADAYKNRGIAKFQLANIQKDLGYKLSAVTNFDDAKADFITAKKLV